MYMTDIPATLSEMKRVLKPGGYICCSETDFTNSVLSPGNKVIEESEISRFKASSALGMDCYCGQKLEPSALKAGLKIKQLTDTVEVFKDETLAAICKWLKIFWQDSELRNKAIEDKLITTEQIMALLEEVKAFPNNAAAFYELPYKEMVCSYD